ncbi:hypothetical protein Cgig2_013980 [Carnegiea gigantea]|uniref:Apple domain-containing protein n=1 Tax=Carnegiea gigantea TaxID=171969 RepID=A0A9Q1KX85_9CARY|nr:hypothetical protein Cgig2_013980 [Carnegiea gigantea]
MKTPIHVINPVLLFLLVACLSADQSTAVAQQLLQGFVATPDPTAEDFQPILTDSTGNFSLSFLRVNQHQLALAIVHVPSGVPLWQAGRVGQLARWGKPTQLIFNGSLVITDSRSGVFWSTKTDGDRVVLTSEPNLQILKGHDARNSLASTLWQSFDFPSDTLVENQNFSSAMRLVSSNGLYAMRLGPDFIGLYAKFMPGGLDEVQIYYRHRALEAKAQIIEGHGPILVRISSDGFLGMYQNTSVPADIQTFNSYQRPVPGPRRVRIESDGNLKGYYWSGSSWALDYQLIAETCDLPSPCGPYGLCTPGEGCSCLDNRTQIHTSGCYPSQTEPGDLCEGKRSKSRVLRRTGVELPFKDLMLSTETASYEECEKACDMNCTCWGAVYNNASGKCYTVDYPIQTILGAGDESKLGYFKVWEGPGKKKMDMSLGIGVVGFGGYKLWKRKSRVNSRYLEEDEIVAPGPYKDLGSSSFGSIELSSR